MDTFQLTADRKQQLVNCVLYLKSFDDPSIETESIDKTAGQEDVSNSNKNLKDVVPTVQGSVLLQSLLKLPDPHNAIVIDRYIRQFYMR